MITEPTVFVLGAGSSKPYGYPIGRELVTIICNHLSNPESRYFRNIFNQGGFKKSDIEQFRDALLYSGKSSVDAFLEHRKEFIEIGKYTIAQALIQYEDERSLFNKGDWYQYFYEKLNTSFDEFDKNKIGIVTFNYDRSFEHYLFTALKNTYGKSSEECALKMKNIPILHVHGQLGYLPWQNNTSRKRKYGGVLDADMEVEINVAAMGIKIIHEDINSREDESFIKAHSLINDAKTIYFLGFGYHETNVKRLAIPVGKALLGTSYRLEDAELSDIRKMIHTHTGNDILFEYKDVLRFFRSTISFR